MRPLARDEVAVARFPYEFHGAKFEVGDALVVGLVKSANRLLAGDLSLADGPGGTGQLGDRRPPVDDLGADFARQGGAHLESLRGPLCDRFLRVRLREEGVGDGFLLDGETWGGGAGLIPLLRNHIPL